MTSPATLAAGLEAQDWRQTASVTADWRRYGKFGRGAMYVIENTCQVYHKQMKVNLTRGELWFSPLWERYPEMQVIGPMLQQVLKAGSLDSQALLIELLDCVDENGGRENEDNGEEHDNETAGTRKSSG